jgi:hypothetical protein
MPVPDNILPLLGFPAFLLLFAAIWGGAMLMISKMGGWRTLARRHTAAPNRSLEGETFRAASATMGKGMMPANYKGCLVVNFGRTGIYMRPWVMFRFFHPPLLIPWRAVKSVEPEKFWLRNCAKIEVADFEGSIRLYGKPGEEAVRAWERFRR